MAVYVFEVYVDELEDVFRYIEVESNTTFEVLHKTIVDSFSIKGKKEAVFFESNRRWQKLREISLDGESTMENAIDGVETAIEVLPANGSSYLIYFNENLPKLNFLIQLNEVDVEDGATYPRVTKKQGVAKALDKFKDNIIEELNLYDNNLDDEFGYDDF